MILGFYQDILLKVLRLLGVYILPLELEDLCVKQLRFIKLCGIVI